MDCRVTRLGLPRRLNLRRSLGLGAELPDAGGGGYHASAVHFDGLAGITVASMANVTISDVCSVVYWIKVSALTLPSAGLLWAINPAGSFAFYSQMNITGFHPDAYITSSTFGDGASSLAIGTNDDNEPYMHADAWVCVVETIDTLAQKGMFYLNGVISNADFPIIPGSPFTMTFGGLPFKLCDDGFEETITCDLADFRFMPGISLLTGDTISAETMALFIDENGKPVNPSVATADLGPPCILLSGNASSFVTNQGNGGPAVLNGGLTNAATSPSD